MTAPESPALAAAARLRLAVEAVADGADEAAQLADRIVALGQAAVDAQRVAAEQGPVSEVTKRQIRNEVVLARAALARCTRTRNALRDIVAALTGSLEGYGRDGAVAAPAPAQRAARHV
jgi:hypothetical protein